MQIQKSWFHNDLGRLLQERLQIKVSEKITYNDMGESIFVCYKYLWLKDSVRPNMIEDGIGSLAIIKKISKDDASNSSADTALAFETFGTKHRINLSKFISNHGSYSSFNLNHTFAFIITLSKANKMTAQSGQKWLVLWKTELEYETIDSEKMSMEIQKRFMEERKVHFTNMHSS